MRSAASIGELNVAGIRAEMPHKTGDERKANKRLWSQQPGDNAGAVAVDNEMHVARDAGHLAPRQGQVGFFAALEPELFLAGSIGDMR